MLPQPRRPRHPDPDRLPLRDAPNVYVMWELPDGGDCSAARPRKRSGPVVSGRARHLTRRARFDAAGIFQVSAKAYFLAPGDPLAALGVLFFDVRDGNLTVSELDPRTPGL